MQTERNKEAGILGRVRAARAGSMARGAGRPAPRLSRVGEQRRSLARYGAVAAARASDAALGEDNGAGSVLSPSRPRATAGDPCPVPSLRRAPAARSAAVPTQRPQRPKRGLCRGRDQSALGTRTAQSRQTGSIPREVNRRSHQAASGRPSDNAAWITEPYTSRHPSASSSLTTTTSTNTSRVVSTLRSRADSLTTSSTDGSMTRKSKSLCLSASPRAYDPNRITRVSGGAASNSRRPASAMTVSSNTRPP